MRKPLTRCSLDHLAENNKKMQKETQENKEGDEGKERGKHVLPGWTYPFVYVYMCVCVCA